MSKARFTNNSEPDTPPTGKTFLYVDVADKLLKIKQDDGTVINLSLSVGGNDTEIQFNDGGSFGADPLFTYDNVTKKLNVGTPAVDGYIGEDVGANNLFIGASDTTNVMLGELAIGSSTPATSAILDLSSTTKALLITRMSTIERDALTAVNGMIIYNSTTNAFNFYENGSWVTK